MPITDRHQSVLEIMPEWRKIRDVLAGPRKVKALQYTRTSDSVIRAGVTSPYIPRLPGQEVFTGPGGETIDEYANYVRRANLLPFAGPLLNRMCGLVFRKVPTFTLPAGIEPQLANITLDGCTAENFSWQVLRTNISTGFGVISVDYSGSLNRPYQRLYADAAVIDWRHTIVDGVPVLSHVRLLEYVDVPQDEFTHVPVEQIRVIEVSTDAALLSPAQLSTIQRLPDLYQMGFCIQRLFREAGDTNGRRTGEWVEVERFVPHRRGQPLPFLPVVPFNPFAATWSVETPPMCYLADLILSHLLNSADYEQLLHECGAGTVLFGAGFSELEQEHFKRVGGGALAFTANPDSSLSYVQTSGVAGKEIREAMEDKKLDMARAVGRLLMAQNKNVAESGAALSLQFSGDDANLQTIAGATAFALEQALKIHVWWASTAATLADVTDVAVNFSDAFVDAPISPADAESLVAIRDSGSMTDEDLFYKLKQGEILAPETTFDDWLEVRGSGNGLSDRVRQEVAALLAEIEAANAAGDEASMADAIAGIRRAMSSEGTS